MHTYVWRKILGQKGLYFLCSALRQGQYFFLLIESDDCHQTKHKTTAMKVGEPQDHLTKMIKHFAYFTDTGTHKWQLILGYLLYLITSTSTQGCFVINLLSPYICKETVFWKVNPTANVFIWINYYPTHQPSTFYRTRTQISVIFPALMPVTIGSI